MTAREKRISERVPIEGFTSLYAGPSVSIGCLENLSADGLFVSTQDLLPVGSAVDISFFLTSYNRKIIAKGIVTWTRSQENSINFFPGMGLQFLEMKMADQELLDDYVKQTYRYQQAMEAYA